MFQFELFLSSFIYVKAYCSLLVSTFCIYSHVGLVLVLVLFCFVLFCFVLFCFVFLGISEFIVLVDVTLFLHVLYCIVNCCPPCCCLWGEIVCC